MKSPRWKQKITTLLVLLLTGIALPRLAPAQTPSATPSPVPSDPVSRIENLRDGLNIALDGFRKSLLANTPDITVRDTSYAALLVLLDGDGAAEAESLLGRVFALQSMDETAPDYGKLPWNLENVGVSDENGIEFGSEAWGPIFLGYKDLLSPEFNREAIPHMKAALAALQRHNVPVAYTNIFLMNTVNTLLLAQIVGDDAQHQRGLSQLNAWMDYTRTNGIHEFDSPVYYSVGMLSLLNGYRYAKQPEIREKFRSILDYFWKDIAANHDTALPTRLLGAHSRDYDFLRGAGGVNVFFYTEGLLPTRKFEEVPLDKVFLLANGLNNGYHPSGKILEESSIPERVVLQRWDQDPLETRFTYITPDFSIGTATADYGPQDKLFALDLFSSKDLPDVTVVPDPTGEPYGLTETKDKSGHSKPHHSPLHPAVVQDKGTVVLLLDLDPSHLGKAQSFATNLILPSLADEIILDGKPVDLSTPVELPATADSVIGVHEGNACFAARFFHVDALGDEPPVYEVRAEETGLAKGAARFVVYHTRRPLSKSPVTSLRVGLIIQAASWKDKDAFVRMMSDLGKVEVKQQNNGDVWTVSTTLNGTDFLVAQNISTRQETDARVNGVQEPGPIPPLSVNKEVISLP
ncbi:MAG: hypothetical protein LV481_04425 [Methylacidiphilales bacterium]|nr:hypothetical protein [Candidatus Methylacidiphilales bacterium]